MVHLDPRPARAQNADACGAPLIMARGWESKSVEAQQADREEAPKRAGESIGPEEAVRRARRRTLELARARAEADLRAATNPAHRQMLEAALAALNEQLR
jgi:hypothetical protein